MFHLQKSKWYYLIDVFINNFLYLGNIFPSDDNETEIHIPYMYKKCIQQNVSCVKQIPQILKLLSLISCYWHNYTLITAFTISLITSYIYFPSSILWWS